jgi:hypothetical protein
VRVLTLSESFLAHTLLLSNYPVIALAKDVGSIKDRVERVAVWTVGLVRDPSIAYSNTPTGTEDRRSYFWTKFDTVAHGVRTANTRSFTFLIS